MKDLRIKVCGMRDPGNIAEVVRLKPHYMGFILYKDSPRYVSPESAADLVKDIPPAIKKTGVLVNEPIEHAVSIARSRIFDLLQLHGSESPEYCRILSEHIRIIKAFQISDRLPDNLADYQPFCNMFLFDSSGKKFGGTGHKFNHETLKDYSLDTGYILGGGISPADADYLRSLNAPRMAGIDLNSRFETAPGVKDINLLKNFIRKIENDNID